MRQSKPGYPYLDRTGWSVATSLFPTRPPKTGSSAISAASVPRWRGAAIAQAAYLNKIPFVILRAISDKADDSATMVIPAFEKKAIEHSVRLVLGMMEALA